MADEIGFPRMWKLWVLGCLVALVLLGSTQLRFFDSHAGWGLFIKEIAFALVIASVFGLTIEQIFPREFVKLVTEERKTLKKDVFLYAYGHNIPDDVKEEIRETILSQPFYRQNLTLEWEFSLIEKQPEFLLVKKEYSYELVNNSNENKSWPFTFYQIGADDIKAVAECQFIVLRIQRGNEVEKLRPDEMTKGQPLGQPHTRQFSTTIETKAHEHVKIYYQTKQKRRLSGGDDYHPSVPVTGRTTVRLHFPTVPAFQVTVACKTRALKEGVDSEPPSRYSYYLDEGLLPYQGITISWSRSEESADGGADLAPPQSAV
jgi:hypothetical protein